MKSIKMVTSINLKKKLIFLNGIRFSGSGISKLLKIKIKANNSQKKFPNNQYKLRLKGKNALHF